MNQIRETTVCVGDGEDVRRMFEGREEQEVGRRAYKSEPIKADDEQVWVAVHAFAIELFGLLELEP